MTVEVKLFAQHTGGGIATAIAIGGKVNGNQGQSVDKGLVVLRAMISRWPTTGEGGGLSLQDCDASHGLPVTPTGSIQMAIMVPTPGGT